MISSAQELLKRHGIPYVTTKKSTYTTTCPECRRGYLSVKIDAKGATWFCHQCGYGGPRKDNGGGDGGGDLGPIKATFDYQDEDGRRLFQVLKFEPLNSPKTFRQRVGPEQEKWSIKGVRIVPFRLPELIEDLASDHVVFVAEGEKDVETLRAHGIPATCNPMGAGKWWSSFNEIFKGGDIILCGDSDAPGRNHVKLVASNLRDVVRRLRILDLAKFWPEIKESDDISDWFAAGGTVERLWEMVEQLSDAGDCDGRDDGDGGGADASARDWEDGDPGAEQSLDEWDAGDDPGAIPPRQWLLGNQFCRGFISSIVAAGGAGKSALRLVQFISLAIGRPLCGQHVFCRSRVLLISLEDDRGELQRRIKAILDHYGISRDELKGWLFCASPRLAKLAVLKDRSRSIGPLEQQLRAAIERRKPDIISLDPFIKTHSLEENDSGDMDFVCDLLARIAIDFNIAVDSPHHVHKGQIAPGDADSGRGSSGIRDAGRLVYTLAPMSEDEAKSFNINPDDRCLYIRLDSAKVNITARLGRATWFRIVSVSIGNATSEYPNGDTVQVVEPWSPPDTWAGLDSKTLNFTLSEIDRGLVDDFGKPDGRRYSGAPSAKGDRAAWRVVQRNCPDRSEAQCREIIRTWERNGLLVTRNYVDPVQRKELGGLYVDDAKRPS